MQTRFGMYITDKHACLCKSSVYMIALHEIFYVINLACTHVYMHVHKKNEKRVVLSTWCTGV